ncbi:MAG TPA: VOC family protein [Chitinophagales bacterium]|nr:VOC family protein [Chitinophagales bacterium]
MITNKIIPCLWFESGAEEAAKFYTSIFKNSGIGKISRYSKEGIEIHKQPVGSVMAVEFTLDGHKFTALNGSPGFKFNWAISLQVMCKDQAEIDHFWNRLTEGGEEVECGWLTDKYGLTWQVVPEILGELMSDPERAPRVTSAFLKMKKLDIETLLKA